MSINSKHKKYLSAHRGIYIPITLTASTNLLFLFLIADETRRAMVPVWVMFIVIVSTLLLILAAAYWKYPVLTDKELIIKNVLFRSYRKRVIYSDIQKIEICHGGQTHYPNIKIYLKSGSHPLLYAIDCMSVNSVPEFLKELESNGVEASYLLD